MPFLEAFPEAREFEIVEVVKMTLLRKILNTLSLGKRGSECHGEGLTTEGNGFTKIGIVGSPNVGKSVVFNRLTRRYVTVSNYPGTTVNVSRGKAKKERGVKTALAITLFVFPFAFFVGFILNQVLTTLGVAL